MDTPQQDGATWCFSPPKRSNGKVLLGFCRKGEKGSDLDAFLEIVKALGGRVVSEPFSLFDSRYEISVGGKSFLLIDDELSGLTLIADEAEGGLPLGLKEYMKALPPGS